MRPARRYRRRGRSAPRAWSCGGLFENHYVIEDAAGVELLMQACVSADMAAALSAAIAKEGVTVRTKSEIRAHPALRDELARRVFISRQLERLGLNLESVRPVGGVPKK